MEEWLASQNAQYVQTLQLVNRLIESGFSPIPTTPTSHDKARGDHTLAIIEVLSAWSEPALQLPLHLFSSGPVFEHGKWADSLDVEILEDGGGPSEAEMFATIHELLEARQNRNRSELTMVMGQTLLLEAVLTGIGCSREEIAQVRRNFQVGQILGAEQLIGARDPEVLPLLRPLPPTTLRRALQERSARWGIARPDSYLDLLPEKDTPDYQVRWDLSLIGSWPYYSGLVCSLFAPNQGRALLKGGRFSVRQDNREWHGVGFTIALEPWHLATAEAATEGRAYGLS